MEVPSEIPSLGRKTLFPFIISALIWLILSGILCFSISANPEEARRALVWMLRLAFISLLDLLAIAKVFYYVFELQRDQDPGKRIFSVIRTSYWGALKIACILICGTILVKGSHLPAGIPVVGLVTGISTLVIVPLVGGAVWYFTHRAS
jgi:hypothetical protein